LVVPGVAVDGLIEAVVAEFDHKYVYGAVPPLGFAVNVAGAFAQTAVGPLIVAVGFAVTVRTGETVVLQPFASVTVTLKLNVPADAVEGLIDCVVAEFDHKYVYGAVPPVAFAVRVADPFAHTETGPAIVTAGFGFTVNVAVVSAGDPTPFVKCARY